MERPITKESLLKIFTYQDSDANIAIKDFSVSEGSKFVDNYSSNIVYLAVNMEKEGKDTTRQLVIKHPGMIISRKDNDAHQRRLFLGESSFYCSVVPAMIESQIKQGLQPLEPPVPRHIFSSVDNTGGLIVLEDLRPEGYTMSHTPLDYDHCKIFINGLAKFHALSHLLKKGNKCNLKKYESALDENMWACPIPEMYHNAFKLSMKCIKRLTSSEHIIAVADKLENFNLDDLMTEQLHPIEPHALICHGDSWRNNMLFKYEHIGDEEVPVDVKLIDFQLCRYAVPTTDLSLFLFLSTTREVRETNHQDFLVLYHRSVMEYLTFLNVAHPEFSLETLKNLYKRKTLYGVLCFYILIPLRFIIQNRAKSLGSVENHFLNFARSMEQTEMYRGQKFVDPIEELVNCGIL